MHHLMLIFQKYQELFIDTLRCLVNSNPKDSSSIQSGTTPSNYYPELQHHYQEDSYVFPKMKSRKYQKLWPNTYQEEPFDPASDHMPRTFSLSKRKTANYVQYKITDLSINGQRKIATYPH